MAVVTASSPSRWSRIPAWTYRVSAEIRSPWAIRLRISALGLRSPRSTWLRYGFETSAALASWRRDICA